MNDSARQRPFALLAFLIVASGLSVYWAWKAATGLYDVVAHSSLAMRWEAYAVVVNALVRIVALGGVWAWRRWGVVLWLACTIFGAWVMVTTNYTLGTLFLGLLPIVVFLLCIWPAWDQFE